MIGLLRELWRLPDPRDEAERAWDLDARGETALQRLDRNWSVLMQEMRVLQTGVQVLIGFLLIVPFQSRFGELSTVGVTVYLTTAGFSLLAVSLLLAPIALHRVLFRHHGLHRVVRTTHRQVMAGIGALAVALTGTAAIVVLMATGSGWGGALGAALTAAVLCWLWVVVPLRALRELGVEH